MWTQLLGMRGTADPEIQRRVLEQLCRNYWQPLFQYARRLGNPPERAQDLTQGFFLQLLEKDLFGRADREKGKLRTLLLSAFSNFIRGEHDKATARKRGGAQALLSLDALEEAESAYQVEADPDSSPEAVYDRRCALELLSSAAAALEAHYTHAGKAGHYESLKQFLTVSGNEQSYSEQADMLGIRADHYKVLVQRFRSHFKEALKAQVRQTLQEGAGEAEVQQEVLEVIRQAYAS